MASNRDVRRAQATLRAHVYALEAYTHDRSALLGGGNVFRTFHQPISTLIGEARVLLRDRKTAPRVYVPQCEAMIARIDVALCEALDDDALVGAYQCALRAFRRSGLVEWLTSVHAEWERHEQRNNRSRAAFDKAFRDTKRAYARSRKAVFFKKAIPVPAAPFLAPMRRVETTWKNPKATVVQHEFIRDLKVWVRSPTLKGTNADPIMDKKPVMVYGIGENEVFDWLEPSPGRSFVMPLSPIPAVTVTSLIHVESTPSNGMTLPQMRVWYAERTTVLLGAIVVGKKYTAECVKAF